MGGAYEQKCTCIVLRCVAAHALQEDQSVLRCHFRAEILRVALLEGPVGIMASLRKLKQDDKPVILQILRLCPITCRKTPIQIYTAGQSLHFGGQFGKHLKVLDCAFERVWLWERSRAMELYGPPPT